MKKKGLLAIAALLMCAASVCAQTANPTVSFYSRDDAADVTMSPGDAQNAQAPLEITMEANIEDAVGWTPKVEWIIYDGRDGSKEQPLLSRFEENSKYTLEKSGEYDIVLLVTFVNSDDEELEYESEPMQITIATSQLSCPDGFSPNGDNINDVFKVTYHSIVKMEGAFFNRWGQKLYSFDLKNVDQGWDGRFHGDYVKDGVYYLNLQATGSDGIHYDIRKAVNVLTKYRDDDK